MMAGYSDLQCWRSRVVESKLVEFADIEKGFEPAVIGRKIERRIKAGQVEMLYYSRMEN